MCKNRLCCGRTETYFFLILQSKSLFLYNTLFLYPVAGKRNTKDKKFGFGGKKRNLKKNDKSSTDDVSGFKPFNKGGAGGKFGGKSRAKGGKKLGKGASKRPGKGNRQKMKNKKK